MALYGILATGLPIAVIAEAFNPRRQFISATATVKSLNAIARHFLLHYRSKFMTWSKACYHNKKGPKVL